MAPLRRRWLILVLFWLMALVVALAVDRHVAQWVHDNAPIDKHHWPARLVRLPGNYVFVLCVAVLIGLAHRRKWAAALPVVLSGPAVGATYTWVKWMVGRRRPVLEIAPFSIHPFTHGFMGLFKSVSGLSFPSGDATMAFAAAACVSLALPRWSVVFFAWAFLVAVERVLENAHYVSDVVAGAGLGLLCGWGAAFISGKLLRRPMDHVGRALPAGDPAAGNAHPTLTNHG